MAEFKVGLLSVRAISSGRFAPVAPRNRDKTRIEYVRLLLGYKTSMITC